MRWLLALLAPLMVPAAHAASVDGLNIHYTVRGTGQTIIFVHGWTCDDRSWSRQVPAFQKHYRVVTLDLPGHGQSGQPTAFSIPLFARAVEAVRAEVGAERVVLVGHSMGAGVSRMYALMYPQHLAGLVAADGTLDIRPFAELAKRATPMTHTRRVAAIEGMFVPQTSEPLRNEIRAMMLRPSQETSMGANAAMLDPAIQSDQVVNVPALTIWASSRNPAGLERTRELFPDWEGVTIPNTGHFLMMEQPRKFNALLAAFLKKRAKF